MSPVGVLHVITRMIVGGAQENTLDSVVELEGERFEGRWSCDLATGPESGPEGSLLDEAERRGVRPIVIDELRRAIAPRRDLAAVRRLRQLLAAGDGGRSWPVLHTHSSKAGFLGRVAAARSPTPVVVHTVHGWPFHDRLSAPMHRLYVLLERWAARRCDALVTVSRQDREEGLRLGIGRPEQYHLIRSGVDLEAFGRPGIDRPTARRELGVPPDVPLVGTVIRLSPQKAPLDLVASFAKVVQRVPEAWLLIVGDGPLRSSVEEAIAAAGLRDRVALAGLRREVARAMAAMDVFVLSSLWEGLPRVLPQAMAAGLPVVCTRVGGAAEAVSEGVTGHLVTPRDVEALARRIAELLASPERCLALGAAARREAKPFGVATMLEDLDRLYRDLLGAAGR